MITLLLLFSFASTCSGTNTCDSGPNVSCSISIPSGYVCKITYLDFGIMCVVEDALTGIRHSSDEELCWPDPGGAGSFGGGDNGINPANITTLDELLCYTHGICHY